MVEGGNVLHRVKMEGKLSRGDVRGIRQGNMSRNMPSGIMPLNFGSNRAKIHISGAKKPQVSIKRVEQVCCPTLIDFDLT